MFLRIFAFKPDGEFASWSDTSYASPQDYVTFLHSVHITNCVAWETEASYPQGDSGRYARVMAAIDAGNVIPPYTEREASIAVGNWAVKRGLFMDKEGEEDMAAVPDKKEKPMLQIAQDFVESISEEELIRRTSEATKAICGGSS